VKLTSPDGFAMSVDFKKATEETLSDDLTELLIQVGNAAKSKGSGVVFLLDEVQFINEIHYRALIAALHRVNQKSLPVTLAAAGLPQIPRLTGEARSYAERLFDFPEIGNLEAEASRRALLQPAIDRNVEYEPAAAERAVSWTEGYPFFIQQVGKHAWNIASESPITLADIEAAIPLAQDALDRSLYEVRIQRASATERQHMRAMAELGAGPYKAGDIAKMRGRTTTDLSGDRDSLIKKGLIYATPEFGYVAFTVPRFDDYMRRYMAYKPPRPRKRLS
jgi:hypothetical protein